MSGWKEIEEGNVTIIHHSPSSTIQICISDSEFEYWYEGVEVPKSVSELWLSYEAFKNLRTAINQTDFP